MSTKVQEYLHRWQGVTMHTTAAILISLDFGSTAFRWGGNEHTINDILVMPCAKHMLANEIEYISFCGGPPGNVFTVEGTLLTLLVDRLLYNEALLEMNRSYV